MSDIVQDKKAARQTFRIFLLVVAMATAFVAIGPTVLDPYTVNILIRAFLYAVAVLTIDVLWGGVVHGGSLHAVRRVLGADLFSV